MSSTSDASNVYRVSAGAPNFSDLSAGVPRLIDVTSADSRTTQPPLTATGDAAKKDTNGHGTKAV
jgi:hypothetical protein